ncbi:hypothetical protein [Streptomyces sp. NPDC096033]|uniref:hypothetical protein n=1 Tax=Streptomyces sp. NPDC096033 TaxID=3366071 RepID=UPI00381D50F1
MSTPAPVPTHLEYEDAKKHLDQLRHIGDLITKALLTLGGGGLIFTCINVTVFAIREAVPWYIAWMLDPLVSLALLVVLYVDGLLAPQGYKPKSWPFLLRWFAGLGTWLMNCWSSLYPKETGFDGWPEHPHAAGLLLHSIIPALVILLAEAGAGYRKYLTGRTAQLNDVIRRYQEWQRQQRENEEREARATRDQAAENARREKEREAREAAEQARDEAKRLAEREAHERKIEADRLAEQRKIEAANRDREAKIEAARLAKIAADEQAERDRQKLLLTAKIEADRIALAAKIEADNRDREEAREAARKHEEAQLKAVEEEAARLREEAEREAAEKARKTAERAAARRAADEKRASENDGHGASENTEDTIPMSREARAAQREDGIREAARAIVSGRELTAKELGERFGRRETWGGDCTREARIRLEDPAFREEIETAALEEMLQTEALAEHAV